MEQEKKMKVISSKLSPDDYMKFDDYCWVRRLKKSEVIRKAVKEYMENHQ